MLKKNIFITVVLLCISSNALHAMESSVSQVKTEAELQDEIKKLQEIIDSRVNWLANQRQKTGPKYTC